MAEKKVTMTELTGTKVAFVSLVNRSASRIPFRVLKSDKEHPMTINLSSIGRILKGEKPAAPVQPEITGIVVFDHGPESMPAMMLAIKSEGFSVDTAIKNDDGTILFSQGDHGAEGSSIIKMSDEMALVVKGFDPYNTNGMSKTSTFAEQATTQGFYGSLYNAAETLSTRVRDILSNSVSKSEGVTSVKKALMEYEGYVGSLMTALPEAAFKADTSINSAVTIGKMDKASKASKTKMTPEEIAAAEEAGETKAEEAKETVAKKSNPLTNSPVDAEVPLAVAPVNEAPAAAVDGPTDAEVPAATTKSDMEKMMDAITALTTTIGTAVQKVDSLALDVKAVSDKQATTEGKVDDAVKKADTTANAVKNTILAAPAATDSPAVGKVVKNEQSDPRSGLFDTAYISKRK